MFSMEETPVFDSRSKFPRASACHVLAEISPNLEFVIIGSRYPKMSLARWPLFFSVAAATLSSLAGLARVHVEAAKTCRALQNARARADRP